MKWTKENSKQAVRDGGSVRRVSKRFGIPFITWQERIQKNLIITGPSLGWSLTFSPEKDNGIAENIKLLTKLFYGLSTLKVRRQLTFTLINLIFSIVSTGRVWILEKTDIRFFEEKSFDNCPLTRSDQHTFFPWQHSTERKNKFPVSKL